MNTVTVERNIKDYLHLYLGCSGRVSIDYGPPMRGMKIIDCILVGIVGEIVTLECYDLHGNKWEAEHICRYDRFKPLLRPLSDITKDEVADLMNIDGFITRGNFCAPFFQIEFRDLNEEEHNKHLYIHQMHPNQVLFLLYKHFDLFDLILDGLAISTTKQNPLIKL